MENIKKGIMLLSLSAILLTGCTGASENQGAGEDSTKSSLINMGNIVNGSQSTGNGTTDSVTNNPEEENDAYIIDSPGYEEDADFGNEPVEAEYQPVQAEYVPGYDVEPQSGQSAYNPLKALAFAEKNWDSGKGLCAEFVSECIKAGGITDCSSTSSTQLYNSLIKSGEGFAVKLPINDNGTLSIPEYAFPGDLIFYYCEEENCMIHTLIYNGESKKGFAKALAHNPANSGIKTFKYRSDCTEGCNAELKDVVLFCFYRNPDIMKAPQSVPSVSVDQNGESCIFGWEPDFLYKSSSLVLLDKDGKEIYRKEMGTDTNHRLIIKNTATISAYVEFTVCDGVTVSGNPTTFILNSDNGGETSDSSEIVEDLPPRGENGEAPGGSEERPKPAEDTDSTAPHREDSE